MVSSSLAHADFSDIFGNMVFYLAFAPALELLIGSKIRYLWIMLFIAIVTGIVYSSSVLGSSDPLPTLGFSGVVMGMIGLSAFLMPHARIKVFTWYIVAWKTFYVNAWFLAVCYIGFDAWKMFTHDDYGGINLVAHVSGGIAGYAYGFLWLKERREEIRQELADEMEVMEVERKYGKTRSDAFRSAKIVDEQMARKKQKQDTDRFMRMLYQLVTTHRDSEAICQLFAKYDEDTPTHELEALYDHIEKWGASRTLLCLGRYLIHRLDREKRYGRVVGYIEKCQRINPKFLLPDLTRVNFYAQFCKEHGFKDVSNNLLGK